MKLNFSFIRNLHKRTLVLTLLMAAVMALGIAGFLVAKKQGWIAPKADIVAGRVTWAGASNELQPNFTQLQRTVVSNSAISLAGTSSQDLDAGSLNILLTGLTVGQTGTMEIPITNSAVIARVNQCKQSNGTCYFGIYRQAEFGTSRLKINFSTITLANSGTTVSTANYKSAIRSERDPGNAYSYTYEAAGNSHYTYNLNAETYRLTRSRPFFSFNTFNSTVSTPIIRLNYAVEYVAVGDTPSFQLNLRSLSQGWQGFTPLDYWNKITVGGAGGYESSGTATIPSFNASSINSATLWRTISWANTGSTNTSVSARVKAASTSSALASAGWSSPVTTSQGTISGPALTGQYVAVELTLSTTNTSETPRVTLVTINGNTTTPPPPPPSGSYTVTVNLLPNNTGSTLDPSSPQTVAAGGTSQRVSISFSYGYRIARIVETRGNGSVREVCNIAAGTSCSNVIPAISNISDNYAYSVYLEIDPSVASRVYFEVHTAEMVESRNSPLNVARVFVKLTRAASCPLQIYLTNHDPEPPLAAAISGVDIGAVNRIDFNTGQTVTTFQAASMPDNIDEPEEGIVYEIDRIVGCAVEDGNQSLLVTILPTANYCPSSASAQNSKPSLLQRVRNFFK